MQQTHASKRFGGRQAVDTLPAVFAGIVFVVSGIAAFVSFFVGAPILHSRVPVGIGDPGVLIAILGAGMHGAVLGVFSIAIGAIVRRTAGGGSPGSSPSCWGSRRSPSSSSGRSANTSMPICKVSAGSACGPSA